MPRASGIFGSVGLHLAAMVVLRTAAADRDPTPEARLPIEFVTAPAPESPPTTPVQPEPESVTPTRVRPSRRAATVRARPAAAPTPGEAAPGPGDSSEPPLLEGTLAGGNMAMGSGGGGGRGVGGGGGTVESAGGGGGPPPAKLKMVCDEAAMQALFPASARGEGILEMVVPVRVSIGADGTVGGATAVRDPGHGFGAAAETAVRRHCRVQGGGVAETVTLRVRFVQN